MSQWGPSPAFRIPGIYFPSSIAWNHCLIPLSVKPRVSCPDLILTIPCLYRPVQSWQHHKSIFPSSVLTVPLVNFFNAVLTIPRIPFPSVVITKNSFRSIQSWQTRVQCSWRQGNLSLLYYIATASIVGLWWYTENTTLLHFNALQQVPFLLYQTIVSIL